MPYEYELEPRHAHAKSFYGKARVRIYGQGHKVLVSYGTPVCWWDCETGRFHRLWDRWSATTGRHIGEFSLQIRLSLPCEVATAINKKDWDAMGVEPLPSFLRPQA